MSNYYCLDFNDSAMVKSQHIGFFLKELVNYIFPSEISYHIKSINVDNLIIIDRIDGPTEYSIRMTKKIIEQRAINKKTTKIIFDRSSEDGLGRNFILEKYKYYSNLGIADNNILFFINSNFTNTNIDEHINADPEFDILLDKNIFYGVDYFAVKAHDICINLGHPISNKKTEDRANKVNLLLGYINKDPRPHILTSFYRENLFDRTLLGLLSTNEIVESLFENNINLSSFLKNNIGTPDNVRIEEHIPSSTEKFPKISSHGWSNNCFVYDNSQLSFIAETWVRCKSTFLTEKTFRPLINKHPFIMVGPENILQHLRKLGFITFNSIIDESYDEIPNVYERIDFAVDQAKKFLDTSHTKSLEIDEIVNYNFNHLIKYAESEYENTKKYLLKFLTVTNL